MLLGIIPKYVPVKAVAAYLRAVSVPVPKCIRTKHLKNNRIEWARMQSKAMSGRFIERQHMLTGMRFGNAKASFNCCEAIAAYNVIVACGLCGRERTLHPSPALPDFPEVLDECERIGLVLGGIFGTSTDHIIRFLHGRGYTTKELWGRAVTESSADALAGRFGAFVLTMYNDRNNIFAQVHTVCITRSSGCYYVHNAGITGKRFSTLYDAVRASHRGKGKEILLMGVKR